MRSLDYAHLIMSAEPPFNLVPPERKNMPGRFLCSFSFARPKENEPKEKGAPRKFLTSRANPSADDFVSPASLRACTTKSFTASIDGTKFSQGVLILLCMGKPIPAKAGTGGVRSGNESIEGLNFGANAGLHPDMHALRAPKFLACAVAIHSCVTISDVLFGYPARGGITAPLQGTRCSVRARRGKHARKVSVFILFCSSKRK